MTICQLEATLYTRHRRLPVVAYWRDRAAAAKTKAGHLYVRVRSALRVFNDKGGGYTDFPFHVEDKNGPGHLL